MSAKWIRLCQCWCVFVLLAFAGAASASPFAYIANRDSDTVSVIDTASDTVVSTIVVGDYPHGVAVTPSGDKVFVANRAAGTVSVIDTVSRSVIATITTGLTPISVAVEPSGAFAYAVNRGEDKISVIDTATLAVTGTIYVSDGPSLALMHPTQPRLYIAHNGTLSGLTLSVIDTQTRTVLNTLSVGSVIVGMALHPDGKTLYLVDEASRSVYKVDLSTMAIVSTVILGGDPYGVAVSPSGGTYYVSDLQRKIVSEIEVASNAKKNEISVGSSPKGVQIHPDGKRLYVSNLDSASVSIIDMASAKVTATVSVGLGPVGTGQIFSPLPPAPPKPNVIVIVTDDMREDDMAYMPNLQAMLVGKGIKFTEGYSVSATCCPARASILRGQYPQNSGVTRVGDGFQRFHSSGKELDTLATQMRVGGYRTGLYGKYFVDYPQPDSPTYTAPGWEEWVAMGAVKGFFDYEMVENGATVLYGSAPEEYATDVLSAKVQASIALVKSDKRPLFLYVTPFAPHEPATPAPRHASLFSDLKAPRPPSFDEVNVTDKPTWIQALSRIDGAGKGQIDDLYRNRLRSLQAVDEMLGAMIAGLEAAGVMDNTYVLFSSDQGFTLGEHRIRYGKGNAYEETVSVPFVLRGPGVAAGVTSSSTVLHTDIMPTLLDIASIAIPSYVDGRSLKPLFGGVEPTPWRTRFLIDHTDLPLIETSYAPPSHRAVHTARYTYVDYPDTSEHEFYDRTLDPYQLTNTYATASSTTLQGLATDLEVLKKCAGVSCVAAENLANYSLSVTKTGGGVGTISTVDNLINCGTDCTEAYASGTLVTLTATANTGSTFTGWSAACKGTTKTCTLTVDAAKTATANFALMTYSLTVSKIGTGSGAVSSADNGIKCGADCTENYSYGAVVTLTATPDVGSVFGNWGITGCPGTGTCSLTMSLARTIKPTFVLQ